MTRAAPLIEVSIHTSAGRALQGIAVAHALVGVVVHRDALRSILGDGVVGAVPDRGDRATAFWFLSAGPLLWTTGRLLLSAEASGDQAALRSVGTVVAGTGLVGIATMPVSGFWAVAAVGFGVLNAARRSTGRSRGPMGYQP